jgi:hypothetical protein
MRKVKLREVKCVTQGNTAQKCPSGVTFRVSGFKHTVLVTPWRHLGLRQVGKESNQTVLNLEHPIEHLLPGSHRAIGMRAFALRSKNGWGWEGDPNPRSGLAHDRAHPVAHRRPSYHLARRVWPSAPFSARRERGGWEDYEFLSI